MEYDYERIDSSIQQLNRSLDAMSAKAALASQEIGRSLSIIVAELDGIAVKDEVIDSYSSLSSSVKDGFGEATEYAANFLGAVNEATAVVKKLQGQIEPTLKNINNEFSDIGEALKLIGESKFAKAMWENVSAIAKKD